MVTVMQFMNSSFLESQNIHTWAKLEKMIPQIRSTGNQIRYFFMTGQTSHALGDKRHLTMIVAVPLRTPNRIDSEL